MKQEQGLVIELKDGLARIKVGRHTECVSCGACPSSQHVMVEAINPLGAKPGQRVKFELQEQHMLTGAFVVFVLPLLCAALGAVLILSIAAVLASRSIGHIDNELRAG